MNKSLLSIFIGSILFSSINVQAYDFATLSKLSTVTKAGARYLFSTNGIKDIAATYSVIMLITLIHEVGHAVVAKLLCGTPVDVVIGGPRKKDPYLKIAGVEFAGFNPLESDTRWDEHMNQPPSPEQETAVSLAGPLAQAITGFCMYKCLQNKDNFHIAKAAAIGGLIDTIVGINGIYGAWYLPWTDSARALKNIKKMFGYSSKEPSNA